MLNASKAVTTNTDYPCAWSNSSYCYEIVILNQRTYTVSVDWTYQGNVNTCKGGTAYISARDTSIFTFNVNC